MSAQMRREFFKKKKLILKGLSLNAILDELRDACTKGDLTKIKKLVKTHLNNNFQQLQELTTANEDGQSAPWCATLFINAVVNGQFEVIQFLIRQELNINTQDEYGQTALSFIISTGDKYPIKNKKEMLDFLLKIPNLNLESENIDGDTALTHALHKNNTTLAFQLLEKGANINHRMKDGRTPIIIAIQRCSLDTVRELHRRGAEINTKIGTKETALHYAIARACVIHERFSFSGDYSVAEYLINNGAVLDGRGISMLPTFLYLAIMHKYDKTVEFLLSKNPYPIDLEVPYQGNTPLQTAVKFGTLQMVVALVKKGANRYIVDFQGHSLLMISIVFGKFDIAKFLLDEIEAMDKNRLQDLLLVISGCQNVDIVKLLVSFIIQHKDKLKLSEGMFFNLIKNIIFYAASSGLLSNLEYCLETHVALLSTPSNFTLFQFSLNGSAIQAAQFYAAHYGHTEILKLLLKSDKAIELTKGKTLLMVAGEAGQLEVVKLLIDLHVNVNAKMEDGITALMFAAYHGQTEVVKVLLKHGARLNDTNDNGHTALSISSEVRHPLCTKYLLRCKILSGLSEKIKQDKDKVWQLAGMVSDHLVKNHPIFEPNGNFSIRFKEKTEQIMIKFEDLLNVVHRIFQNDQLDMEFFEEWLWQTTDNYKRKLETQLETKALEEKQALERKILEEKLALEKQLEDLSIGLDYESISLKFPWVSGSNRNLTKVFEEIDKSNIEINDLLEDSNTFLLSSIAGRIVSIKEQKEVLMEQNRKFLIELNKIYDMKQKSEEEIDQLKQAFEDRYLELNLRIGEKIDLKQVEEARSLKKTVMEDKVLQQILEKHRKLGSEVDLLNKKILELQSQVENKRKLEQEAQDQYYSTCRKEQQEEEIQRDLEKKRESEKLIRDENEKFRREAFARKKEAAKAYYTERLAENEKNKEKTKKTKLQLLFEVRFNQPNIKMLDEELNTMSQVLEQFTTLQSKELDEKLKSYHGYGLLNMCARLMEMLLHLPEEMALMSLNKAAHFRDVVYHAEKLPIFTTDEIIQMTEILVQYVKAAKSDDTIEKSRCWALLNGFGKESQSLFARILAHEIEDDVDYLEANQYRKIIEQERAVAKKIQKNTQGIALICGKAVALFIGRMGGNAARIKQAYPHEFFNWDKELQLRSLNELGKRCRHEEISHQEIQSAEWRQILGDTDVEHHQKAESELMVGKGLGLGEGKESTSALSASAPAFVPGFGHRVASTVTSRVPSSSAAAYAPLATHTPVPKKSRGKGKRKP